MSYLLLFYVQCCLFSHKKLPRPYSNCKSATSKNRREQRRSASYIVLDNLNVAPFFSRSGNFISFHDTLPLGRKSDLFFRRMRRGSYDVDDRQCISQGILSEFKHVHFVLLSYNL